MKNKVLVFIYVPLLEEKYDIWIPINKKVGTIKNNIINSINELSDGNLKSPINFKLYDKESGSSYNNNLYVKNSNIVNGTKLLLL